MQSIAQRAHSLTFHVALDTRAVARALAGDVIERNAVLAPGPGLDRSLSVKIDPTAPDGFLCHSFAGDDWRACRDHVLASLGASTIVRGSVGHDTAPEPDDAPYKFAMAMGLWREGVPLSGTLGERYLVIHRGLPIAKLGDLLRTLCAGTMVKVAFSA